MEAALLALFEVKDKGRVPLAELLHSERHSNALSPQLSKSSKLISLFEIGSLQEGKRGGDTGVRVLAQV